MSGSNKASHDDYLQCSSATEVLARYAVGDITHHKTTYSLKQACNTLLDTIGVSLAGKNTEIVKIMNETYLGRPDGVAQVWTTGQRTDPETAAMLNGTATHALDYDDTNESIRGHLSATIWPTVLALSEAKGSSGTAIIEAYLVGVRSAIAIADGMSIDDHYRRGWHSTATVGVLGATCAASRILGLDVLKTRHALGIAASTASGSRQNFGTMTKPLHAGLAAKNAVLAARLAASGFESNPSILEGEIGYYALYGDAKSASSVKQSLSEGWLPSRHGASLKNYAVCYNLHRMCDAAKNIIKQNTININEIDRVVVTVEPEGTSPLIHKEPKTALQCKFSAQFAVAAVLLGKNLGPNELFEPLLSNVTLQSLMKQITAREDIVPPMGSTDWIEGYAVVEILLKSGMMLATRVDYPRGHWGAPFSPDEHFTKFNNCLKLGSHEKKAKILEQEILNLPLVNKFSGLQEI